MFRAVLSAVLVATPSQCSSITGLCLLDNHFEWLGRVHIFDGSCHPGVLWRCKRYVRQDVNFDSNSKHVSRRKAHALIGPNLDTFTLRAPSASNLWRTLLGAHERASIWLQQAISTLGAFLLALGFGLLKPALNCPLDVFTEGGRLAAKQSSQG